MSETRKRQHDNDHTDRGAKRSHTELLGEIVEEEEEHEQEPEQPSVRPHTPRWALRIAPVAEAFANVCGMPEVDYVLYIKWLTIQKLYSEIFAGGFGGVSAPQKQVPNIQQITAMATKYGKLPFVWSADAYVTKYKIVQASERVVLDHFAASKYYKARIGKFNALESATTFAVNTLPKHIAAAHGDQRCGLAFGVPGKPRPVRFAVPKKDVAVYNAYWTALHPADAYKNRVNTLHQKAGDPQALILAWTTVFTIDAAKAQAKVYMDALVVLLCALRPTARNQHK